MTPAQETRVFFDQLAEQTTQLQAHLEIISNNATQFDGWYKGSRLSCRHIVRRIETLQLILGNLSTLLSEHRWPFDIQIGFDMQNSLRSLYEQGDEACIIILVYSDICTSLTEEVLRKRKAVRLQLQQFIQEVQKLIDQLTSLFPEHNVTVVESEPLLVSSHSSAGEEVHDAVE